MLPLFTFPFFFFFILVTPVISRKAFVEDFPVTCKYLHKTFSIFCKGRGHKNYAEKFDS